MPEFMSMTEATTWITRLEELIILDIITRRDAVIAIATHIAEEQNYATVEDYLHAEICTMQTKMRGPITLATEWRRQNGYIGNRGYIYILDDIVNGWCENLCNPRDWQPYTLAVDEFGNIWQANGGNVGDGAIRWTRY